ncbi:Zn-ribbon domain-containing OB-fold protein, partial [bacterium]
MADANLPKKSLPKINKVDQPYWQGAAAGKLLLQKCKACGKLQFFPRIVCVDCFSGDIDWVEAAGTGKVHSFTWVRVPRNPAFKEEVPICYANIILDEGVILESRIVGKNLQAVKMGAKVRVVFQETA